MKQYIVIDFDDVIAETFEQGFLVNLNNHQYASTGEGSITWVKEDFTKWDAEWTTGFSKETIQRLFANVEYKNVGQVNFAVKGIRTLVKEGHSVQVVTANPNEEGIRIWMDQIGLRDIPLTSTPDKITFMLQRGFKVIIDDKPKTLRDASRSGYQAIRFERPWNANLSSPKGDGTVLTFEWGSWKNEHTASIWHSVVKIIADLSEDTGLLPGQKYTGPMGTTTMPVEFKMSGMYDEILVPLEDDKYITPSGDPVTTNANGAKQTDLKARYDLLPALAVAEVAGVLNRGAETYGEDNWRGLSVNEILNHVIGHAIAYLNTGDEEDLAHAATRGLMALEIHLGGGTDGD